MKSCGLIVEYNPFHNGHSYHIQKAKEISKADCMIAVMSGSFLQRGEPAIIDKFHRARIALMSGIDVVLELPYAYAVQSSTNFAKGSVQTLKEAGVSYICFGSESGNIHDFLDSYHILKANESLYEENLKKYLHQGFSYPQASKRSIDMIEPTTKIDLSKPNNILGASYVRQILDQHLPIEPLTIKREHNEYHQQDITGSIASATSIRKQLFQYDKIPRDVTETMPPETLKQLHSYQKAATTWHHWEKYFPLLHYRVMTMSHKELANIYGVDEGLEYRIKQTARNAISFNKWVAAIKTKRYTWTRLQRIFVHILTHTQKREMVAINDMQSVPYIRLLGMSNTGRKYLHLQKKQLKVPIISQLSRNQHSAVSIDEKASDAYYSILPPVQRKEMWQQELEPPILV